MPCRGDEPEPLKRLKREMGVALHEEDYTAAGAGFSSRHWSPSHGLVISSRAVMNPMAYVTAHVTCALSSGIDACSADT